MSPPAVRLQTGYGRSHGAITVVNAIATGRGAAIGIDLATDAEVTLEAADTPRVNVRINDEPDEDPRLARACVEVVLRRLGVEETVAATVATRSTIPISRGLKSSSAAANAICLATVAACGQTVGDGPNDALTDQALLEAGVEAALAAGVTITGAFDDAAACYHGGLQVTDNPARRVVHSERLDDLEVVLVVPPDKVRTFDTATNPTHPLRAILDEAHALARDGKWHEAMLRNSLAYGGSYGLSNRLVLSMLDTGAIAAGISGTGPAQAIVVRRDDWDCFTDIIATLEPHADVLVAHVNHNKAHADTHPLGPLPTIRVVQGADQEAVAP